MSREDSRDESESEWSRRGVLAAAAGATAAFGTFGRYVRRFAGKTDPVPPEWPEPASGEVELAGFDDEMVVVEQTLGEKAHPDERPPHWIFLWNGSGESRSISVEIRRNERERLDGTYDLQPEEAVAFRLFAAGTYGVFVRDERANTRAAFAGYPDEWFDCNDSWTYLQIGDGGTFGMGTKKTTMGCGPFRGLLSL